MIRERDPSIVSDDVDVAEDAELGRVLEAYLADIEAGRPGRPRTARGRAPGDRQATSRLPASHEPGRTHGRCLGFRVRRASPGGSPRFHDHARRRRVRLTTLGPGQLPHVHLRDLPDEPEPLIKPRSAEMPAQNGASLRPVPASRRDRPRRHGSDPQGSRRRSGPRTGNQGAARIAPGESGGGEPIHRGGADRRPASAPGDRAGLRARELSRTDAALFRHEAGQGRGHSWLRTCSTNATESRRHKTCPGSCRSSSRSARRWPMPTPAA